MILELINDYYSGVWAINSFFINEYTPYVYGGLVFMIATIAAFFQFLGSPPERSDEYYWENVLGSLLLPLGLYLLLMVLLASIPLILLLIMPGIFGGFLAMIVNSFKNKKLAIPPKL